MKAVTKTVVKMRKILSIWDSHEGHAILAAGEQFMTSVIRDLGYDGPIEFDQDVSVYGGIRSVFTMYERKTKNWLSYDRAVLHPWADLVTADCLRIEGAYRTTLNGIPVSCGITLDVQLPDEAKQTLYQIGKIRMGQATVCQPEEELTCGIY